MMDFLFKTGDLCYSGSMTLKISLPTLDLMFRRSIFFKRHRVLLSLKTTINELYPKKPKEANNPEEKTELPTPSISQDN